MIQDQRDFILEQLLCRIMEALKSLGPIRWRVPAPLLQAACQGEHSAILVFVEAIQKAWIHEKGAKALAGCVSAPPQPANASAHDLEVTCLPSAMHAAGPASSAGSMDSKTWTSGACAKGGRTSAKPGTSSVSGKQSANKVAQLHSPASRHASPQASGAATHTSLSSIEPLAASGDPASMRFSSPCPLSTQHVLANGCSQATAAAEATHGKITPGTKHMKGTKPASVQQEISFDAPRAGQGSAPRGEQTGRLEKVHQRADSSDRRQRNQRAHSSLHARSVSPNGDRAPSRSTGGPEAVSKCEHQTALDPMAHNPDLTGSCKTSGGGSRTIRRMRSMSAPGGSRKVSLMLKGSEPDEEALRSWLGHNGVKVLHIHFLVALYSLLDYLRL